MKNAPNAEEEESYILIITMDYLHHIILKDLQEYVRNVEEQEEKGA